MSLDNTEAFVHREMNDERKTKTAIHSKGWEQWGGVEKKSPLLLIGGLKN